jgi:outer membrane protein assembly factor BamB
MREQIAGLVQCSEAAFAGHDATDARAVAVRVYAARKRSLVPSVAVLPALIGCLFLSSGMGLIVAGGSLPVTPTIERVSPDGVETIWENQIMPARGRDFHLTLDLNNRLSGIDTWSRRVLWQQVLPEISSTSAPLVFADKNRVLIGVATTIGAVYLLNAANGQVVWMQNVSDRIDVSPLQIKNSIMTVACADGRIYGINIADGHIDYMVQTDSKITALEPVSDGRGENIYAIADKQRVLALNAMTGDLNWRGDTYGEATNSPLVTKNLVIAPTSDGVLSKLWAFDTSGALRWMSTYDHVSSLASADEYIAMAQGSVVTLLRADTGEAVHYWQLKESPAALKLVAQQGRLIVRTDSGEVLTALN